MDIESFPELEAWAVVGYKSANFARQKKAGETNSAATRRIAQSWLGGAVDAARTAAPHSKAYLYDIWARFDAGYQVSRYPLPPFRPLPPTLCYVARSPTGRWPRRLGSPICRLTMACKTVSTSSRGRSGRSVRPWGLGLNSSRGSRQERRVGPGVRRAPIRGERCSTSSFRALRLG